MKAHEHLKQAEGFYELGLLDESWTSLDKIGAHEAASQPVMRLRLAILIAMSRFDDAAAMGVGCCRRWNEDPVLFLRTSAALIELRDYDKALALLKNGPKQLGENPEYHLAIGRCLTQLGEFESAKEALKKCFALDKGYAKKFIDDSDFEDLWRAMAKEG